MVPKSRMSSGSGFSSDWFRLRARGAALGAEIVLCLHDELLVQAPAEIGDATAQVLIDALQETSQRWSPNPEVRFVADVSVIRRWSDAK